MVAETYLGAECGKAIGGSAEERELSAGAHQSIRSDPEV